MPQVARRNMESFQRIDQVFNRQVMGEDVEHPQGIADLPGVAEILNGVKGPGSVNKAEGPPEGPIRADPVVLAVLGQ